MNELNKKRASGKSMSAKEVAAAASCIRAIADARIKRLKTFSQRTMEAALEDEDAEEMVAAYLSKVTEEVRDRVLHNVAERTKTVIQFPPAKEA